MRFERLNGTLRRLFGRLRIDAGSVGGSSSDTGLDVNQSWNTTGNPTAIKANVTNTASGAAANLMDLQVGGVSKLYIDKNGKLTTTDYLNANLSVNDGSNCRILIGANDGGFPGVQLAGDGVVGWASGVPAKTAIVDTRIYRDAANTLAQRRTTDAQESRLYGTYTSATNYQRLSNKSIRQAITAASGASAVSTISIPKYSHLIGVTTRVTTALGQTNGTTGYTVGDGSDADLWGDITGVAIGTTSDAANFTALDALGPSASDRTITLTAKGGNFDGTGVIEVCAFYFRAEAD